LRLGTAAAGRAHRPYPYRHGRALLRRWLARLPHPFTPRDREAGDRYDLSILQAEFPLTQMLDRPLRGRMLFEDIIRESPALDLPCGATDLQPSSKQAHAGTISDPTW
jgi:hypothetical protein